MNNVKHWLVGASNGKKGKEKEDWTGEYINKGVWVNRWEKSCSISIGDIIAIKTTVRNRKGIYVKAIGKVIDVINNFTFKVDWENTGMYDFKQYYKTRTIHQITNPEEIFQIFHTNYEIKNIEKMKEIISLLKHNKNLILTGAPGTGKTHLAIEIAEAITGKKRKDKPEQIGFVQFHPSYDYTDFVEGLRPVKKENAELGFERKDGVFKEFCKKAANDNDKGNNYVFIIDEINRAEISKVFGELFFSIDPGYRGVKGLVKTQYTNLIEKDVFKEGFYVPDYVYIIGTMNDIDRSVESFDFAMRRRFLWKEITALERIVMWDEEIPTWKDEAKKRMESLNKKIESTNGLSSSYHIGPAYFLKLKNYNGDFTDLWKYHLEPLINEYLRGLPDAENELKKLEMAYNLKEE